jgi:hypothetical protein
LKKEVEIIDYSPERGIQLNWVSGLVIKANIEGDIVRINANREGLISLAQHLLTLA